MESVTINSSTMAKTSDDSAGIGNGFVDNALIESIWKALDGRVDRDQITQAILEVEAGYQNARVKNLHTDIHTPRGLEKTKWKHRKVNHYG